MSASPRFGLPYLLPGQAQKEVFHNEALTVLDCALHAYVEDVLADPPDDPELGQAWIVAAGPTGTWADKASQLAGWTEGGWRFVAATPGMIVWNKAPGHWIHWSGSDTPLGEEMESYRLTLSGEGFARTVTVPAPAYLYTAAEQAADGASEPLHLSVRQLGTHAMSRESQKTI